MCTLGCHTLYNKTDHPIIINMCEILNWYMGLWPLSGWSGGLSFCEEKWNMITVYSGHLAWSMREDNASIVLSIPKLKRFMIHYFLQKHFTKKAQTLKIFSSIIETLEWYWTASLHTRSIRRSIKSIEPHPKCTTSDNKIIKYVQI